MKFSCLESLMDYLKHIKLVKDSFFLILKDQNLGKIVDFVSCDECDMGFDCVLFLRDDSSDLCLPPRLYDTGYSPEDFDVQVLLDQELMENLVILKPPKKDNSSFKLIKKLTFK
jgi:hypothetical protein